MARKVFNVYTNQLVSTKEITVVVVLVCSYIAFLWDLLGRMDNIIYETSRQSRFDARYWMLGAGALG